MMIRQKLLLTATALLLWVVQACTTEATSAEVRHSTVVQSTSIAKNINEKEFNQAINNRKDIIILDVRTPQELTQGFVKGAINVNFYAPDFASQLERLDKSKPVYVYCRSGQRSGSAMNTMKNLGFAQVYNLQGGIVSWVGAGNPVTK